MQISGRNRRRVGVLLGIVSIAALSTLLLRKRNEGLLGLARRRTAEARELFAGSYSRQSVELGCDVLSPGQVGGPTGLAVVIRVADHRRLSLAGQRCEPGECMDLVVHGSVQYRLPDVGAAGGDELSVVESLASGGFVVPYVDDGAGPHAGQDDFEVSLTTADGARCVTWRRETIIRAHGDDLTFERIVRASAPAAICPPLPADAACRLRVVEHFHRRPRPPDAGTD